MILAAALAALTFTSCDEWEPVFTFGYDDPEMVKPVEMTPNTTIAELKARYVSGKGAVKIEDNVIVGGQVISEDKTGNIYKSLYIQDNTGAIEIKIGKNALYNDYKLGQWVYVNCNTLCVGAYNGMLQIGAEDTTGSYETSYLESPYLIQTHVFKGPQGTPIAPKELTINDLGSATDLQNPLHGVYVTLKGLVYGSPSDRYGSYPDGRIFLLVYIDSSKDTKDNSNRIFFSDDSYKLTTWAVSKEGFKNWLSLPDNPKRDAELDETVKTLNSSLKEGEVEWTRESLVAQLKKNASAYAVSQYFKFSDGTTSLQVRTSGYSRFADTEIDPDIISGAKTVDFTGILTVYNGAHQFTLIDLSGVDAK